MTSGIKSLLDTPAVQKAKAPKQFDRSLEKKIEQNQPLAHRGDPMSSYQAGDRALRSGRISVQMRFVLDALKTFPNSTSAELAQSAMLDRYNVARRLPALAARGKVERGAERMCKICKCHCIVWRAVT